MKVFAVLVAIVAVASADTLSNEVQDRTRSASSQLRDALEELIHQIPYGFPPSVPPLAPLKLHHEELDVPAVGTKFELTDLIVTGLEKVELPTAKVHVILRKINIILYLPKLSGKTQYSVNIYNNTQGLPVDHDAAGAANFEVEGFTMKIEATYTYGIFTRTLQFKRMHFLMNLEKCYSDISGLSQDSNRNDEINKLICDKLLSTINDNVQKNSDKIEKLVIHKVNDFLKKKKFLDFDEI